MTTEKTENKELIAIGNYISAKLELYDPYLFGLLAVIVVAKLLHADLPTPVVVLPFVAAVLVYLLSSFTQVGSNPFDAVIYKVSSYSSSLSALGQLYLLQKWAKGTNLVVIGIVTMLICAVYIYIQNSKATEVRPFHKWMMLRMVVLIATSSALLYSKFMV
jgi:hypothetical protein